MKNVSAIHIWVADKSRATLRMISVGTSFDVSSKVSWQVDDATVGTLTHNRAPRPRLWGQTGGDLLDSSERILGPTGI